MSLLARQEEKMSAIAGIIHLTKEPVPFEHGRNIMKGLEKFPADDIQVWHKHNAFIGNHAQWITPESVGEQQPFYDSERQCVITADAIIDNREELFEKLQVERSKQKIMPDSQLILLAYYKWGEESPRHLVGDFAYMIWDERNQKLFGARDFSGSRTLYYYKNHERFAFCTTIMPLFTLPGVKKELNEQWLAEFLAIPDMFYTIDTHSTVYMGIEQVPPSHSISIYMGKVKVSRYIYLFPSEKLKLNSNKEYEEAFRDVFSKAISSHIRTHREIGSHLSGGLDSGSVVSFAAKGLKKQNKKLQTFSYIPVDGFTDWTPKSRVADERPFIQSTVEHVGNINDHYLSFDGRSPLTEIDDWLDILEMPYKFFENTFWMKGIYEEAKLKNIGILLNGARGNYTISWGSALDYYAVLLKKLKVFHLYHEIKVYSQNKGIGRKKTISNISKKAFPLFNYLFGQKSSYVFPVLINSELAQRTNIFQKLNEHEIDITGANVFNTYEARRNQFEKLFYWGNGTSGTKLSLRYSLWNRDPTNDIRVIRFCLSLPDSQYVQDGMDRSLIRRSTENLLSDKVRLNQRYRGVQGADGVHRMASSWNEVLKEGKELVEDPIISGYFNKTTLMQALSKLESGPNPRLVFDMDFKQMMRSLIVYRFIKKLL
jgi:asparagine synthase (glutamine-hydrolysing)